MSHKFLTNAIFHNLLKEIDINIADEHRKKGCPHCGGNLHQSDYTRSPFGLPQALRVYYQNRISFCCARCRKRSTSQSVRFFGRRWFPAPILMLISTLMGGATQSRCLAVQRHFGITVNKRTWKRWRQWWQKCFPCTPFWQKTKGVLPIQALQGPLPRILFTIYKGDLATKLMSLLQLLAPLTAGDFRAV
jgi:hypothetical protein